MVLSDCHADGCLSGGGGGCWEVQEGGIGEERGGGCERSEKRGVEDSGGCLRRGTKREAEEK